MAELPEHEAAVVAVAALPEILLEEVIKPAPFVNWFVLLIPLVTVIISSACVTSIPVPPWIVTKSPLVTVISPDVSVVNDQLL